MSRTRGPKKVQLLVYVREDLVSELYLLNPDMISARTGTTKYGAMSGYIEGLIRADLDARKTAIRETKNDSGQ